MGHADRHIYFELMHKRNCTPGTELVWGEKTTRNWGPLVPGTKRRLHDGTLAYLMVPDV